MLPVPRINKDIILLLGPKLYCYIWVTVQSKTTFCLLTLSHWLFSAHRLHPPEFYSGQKSLNGNSFASVLVICLFFHIGQSIHFQKAKELKINNLFLFFMFCLPFRNSKQTTDVSIKKITSL